MDVIAKYKLSEEAYAWNNEAYFENKIEKMPYFKNEVISGWVRRELK